MKESRFVWAFIYIFASFGAFAAAYQATGRYFREQMVPLPFEAFGLAAGLGAMCWTIAILLLIRALFSKGDRR